MDVLEQRTKPKPKAPRISGQQPKDGGMLISMSIGGGTPKQTADAIKRLSALSRRVKVGKRMGATEVIRAERE